jgi:hypothetical protein
MPHCTGDEIVPAFRPAFRQNFVKVTPDALMNGECGISATYSAVGELAGPNGPLNASAARCLIDAAVLHADKAVLHQVQAINAVLNDRFGCAP